MATLGNVLAFELGGGPSPQEAVYQFLRSAVGEGNSTPDVTPYESIQEAWRYARACGLAAAYENDAKAVSQYFPDLATDMIPMYEEILRVGFGPEVSDEEKRVRLLALWTRYVTAVMTPLEQELQKLDERLSFLVPDRDLLREVQHGRMFEDWDPSAVDASGPAFNLADGAVGSKATAYGNYSDDFIFYIRYDLGPGVAPNAEERRIMEQVRVVMNEAMPSWCDMVIFTGGSGILEPCGFILDVDLLDLTVFCA